MRPPLGVIHGRFQGLHNDHLRYLLAGKERCERLIIGVTNPDPASAAHEATAPERSEQAHNPFSYAERKAMIEAAFAEAGVCDDEYEVIPFPISDKPALAKVAPKDATYFLTIYDEWGWEKKKRFEELGLNTHVMWERPLSQKGISGTAVRRAIRDGGEWEAMVPPAVAALIHEWDVRSRLSGSGISPSGS